MTPSTAPNPNEWAPSPPNMSKRSPLRALSVSTRAIADTTAARTSAPITSGPAAPAVTAVTRRPIAKPTICDASSVAASRILM